MIPNKTWERQVIPLDFQNRIVRSVLIDGVPWFAAKDVCDILGIQNPTETLRNFPDDERMTLSTNGHSGQRGGAQSLNIVNEPGLYRLIFQSRKPEAEKFKGWVFNAVLPQIRRNGFFFPGSPPADGRLLAAAIARYFDSKRPDKQRDIETGRNLVLLKRTLPHGEFLPLLASMGVPHRSALRCMNLYRESAGKLINWKETRKLPGQLFPGERQAGILPAAAFSLPFLGRQLTPFHFRNGLPLAAY